MTRRGAGTAPLQRLLALDWRCSARLVIPHEARFLRLLALVVAHSGDSPLWLAGAAMTLVWGSTTWRDFGWRVLVGALVTGAATTALKWVFRRQRPPGEGLGFYTQYDRHAFPSGHAGRSACMVVLLTPLLPPWGTATIALWAGLVGLARVALEVHFISDIIGGWATGLLVGMALLLAF
ncbi:MAG: phosphatase PAP2 family protein [Chloroflexota bacterium]|nr:phosphatase PAP2 family protein [Chloroflexota bacterium]